MLRDSVQRLCVIDECLTSALDLRLEIFRSRVPWPAADMKFREPIATLTTLLAAMLYV